VSGESWQRNRITHFGTSLALGGCCNQSLSCDTSRNIMHNPLEEVQTSRMHINQHLPLIRFGHLHIGRAGVSGLRASSVHLDLARVGVFFDLESFHFGPEYDM